MRLTTTLQPRIPSNAKHASTSTGNLSPPRAQPAHRTQHQHQHPHAPPSSSQHQQHKHQQPVSTTCTGSSQHQHPHRTTTCAASSQHQHQQRHPAPSISTSSSNLSPPRAQPAHSTSTCTSTRHPAPAPATCPHHMHSQLTAPAPAPAPGTRHPAPAPATCLHHAHSQLTAPAPTPAPSTSTSNLSRKRARATRCYLKYEPHSFAIWGKLLSTCLEGQTEPPAGCAEFFHHREGSMQPNVCTMRFWRCNSTANEASSDQCVPEIPEHLKLLGLSLSPYSHWLIQNQSELQPDLSYAAH